MSLSDSSSLLDLGILNSLGLIVSACVTVYLFLLTLFNFTSCHLFVLVIFTFFTLFEVTSLYGFTSFSPILTDSPLIILDEYGNTLVYMIVFVLFYRILTYSLNHSDSVHKTRFLIWLIVLISLSSLAVFTNSRLLVIYIGYEISLLPIILIIFL